MVPGGFMIVGWQAVVNAFMPPPPTEDPDFYRVGVYVMGKEIFADMMRPRTAQMVSLIFGLIAMIGGLLWILHYAQL